MESRVFAAATFEDQDAGSGPVHSSPNLGPMSAAIHNISTRNLHDINTGLPDDRQFLRSWRRNLQDCISQQNARIVQFLIADASGDIQTTDVVRRCTDILSKYSKPTWNFASSTRDLSLPSSTTDAAAAIEQELGISPATLREYMRKAIRLYANAASALSSAEIRLEEKLKRLETLVGRINDLMFLEPTAELEQMTEPAHAYLNSVLSKISIDTEYTDLVEQYKRFALLKGVVNIGAFQKQAAPICTICMTKEICHAVTPCGHTFCEECCQKQLTACYICRVQIRDKIRLFFN
jgi:hypothetical protein